MNTTKPNTPNITQCAGVILAIDSESESEADMLDELHEKIVLAIRGTV